MSLLKPEVSLPVALATSAVVYAIYGNIPDVPDIRVSEPNDADLAGAEKTARWTSAGVVAGISLVARDPNIFIIGGIAVIVMSWWHRHANMLDPVTGKLAGSTTVAPEVGSYVEMSENADAATV